MELINEKTSAPYLPARSATLASPQKKNELKIFGRGETKTFECVREKRLVNIGVQ